MSSSAAFVVKSVYQGDYRRFNLLRPSFELLRQSLTVSYPELPGDFTVKYTDDEGDLCLITSDMELAEAAHVATQQSSPLKVTVCTGKSPVDVVIQDEKEESSPVREESSPVPKEVQKEAPAKTEMPPVQEDKKEVPVKTEAAPVQEEKREPTVEKKIPISEDEQPKVEEGLDLAFQALKDSKVQAALPGAIEAALASLRQGATSVQVILENALTASALKDHPAIQKLLPFVSKIAPIANKWLEQTKAFIPIMTTFIQQHLSRLPELLAKADFEKLRKCVKEKLDKCTRDGLCELEINFPDAPHFDVNLHADLPLGAEKVDAEKEPVHRTIRCDGCGMHPLVGIRYKCTVCPDYDLCSACEAKDVHPSGHALLKIKEAPRPDVHHGITCDGCETSPIQGIRYKCTVCRDYDLCAPCEAKNQHNPHHPLIKLKVATPVPIRRPRPFRFFCRKADRKCQAQTDLPQPTEQPKATTEPTEQKPVEQKPVEQSKPVEQPKSEPKVEHKRPVATFVRDLNLPDGVGVVPGETLTKGWEFENPSTVAWPEGSKLVFSLGSKELLVDSVEEFPVPLAKPGEKVQVSCPIRVPNKPGRFQASFILVDKDKIPFEGHRCWVQLMIAEDDKKSAPKEAPKEAPKVETETAPKVETAPPKVEPKPEVKEAPKTVPAEPAKPDTKAKQDVDPALKDKYKNELRTLEGMGFSQVALNVFLLQKYKGSIERTVTGLIEQEKSR